jgi:hypothetical protein
VRCYSLPFATKFFNALLGHYHGGVFTVGGYSDLPMRGTRMIAVGLPVMGVA